MDSNLLPIDHVAKQSGIASSALRYYERVGLVEEGVKIGGKRHYPSSVLNRLSMIRTCQAIGFSLTEIAFLLDESDKAGGNWKGVAARRREDIQREIEERRAWLDTLDQTLACACPQLTECPLIVDCPLLEQRDA